MKEGLGAFFLNGALAVFLFFSGVFSWLTPLPIFYIAKRFSLKSAVFTSVLIAFFLVLSYHFLFLHFPEGTPFLNWLPGMSYQKLFDAKVVWASVLVDWLFYASIGCSLAHWISTEKKVLSLLTKVIFTSLGIASFVVLILAQAQLSLLVDSVQKYLSFALDQVIVLNKSSGLSGDEIGFLEANRTVILKAAFGVIPSVTFVATLLVSWINLVLGRRILLISGKQVPLEDLSLVRLPFYFVWMVIANLALYLIHIYFLKNTFAVYVVINLSIVLSVIYFLQGLSIAHFYFAVRAFSPFIRWGAYLMFFLFLQPMALLLVGVGFFDSWFNFRKHAIPSSHQKK
ncbi:MAG: DUF2232 domain-containing protein [Deltaproteobacteria bacterium]|nr:DUF2232 domain-containing protein [Deltaproteobacteria bacterium]